VITLAVALMAVAVATGGAAAGSPLFWLGCNAAFVVAILLGVVLHQAYRGRWAVGDAGVVFSVVLVAYLIALRHGPTSAVSGIYTNSSVVAVVVFGALFLARDRLPYSRLIDGLSNISYPLYLLHGVNGYVVIRAVHAVTGNYHLGLLAALSVTVIAATAVHFLVETPTNNLGRRVARRVRADPAVPVETPYVSVAGELRP
jgi:peptidoglycan/LPS O-acetylase OafA/YrhL